MEHMPIVHIDKHASDQKLLIEKKLIEAHDMHSGENKDDDSDDKDKSQSRVLQTTKNNCL